ncbi:hypothetical protein [Deinococcus aerophilus]|uniref:hypothetical protein n=1 Tax=Deinococcus aerophilus TaxID=522488 RepID=UPI00166CBCE3|nr:hypothetical protein [Deinococcus aerophilus]
MTENAELHALLDTLGAHGVTVLEDVLEDTREHPQSRRRGHSKTELVGGMGNLHPLHCG